jgi:4-hydroxybenzoate polyprenyltransferase
MGSAEPAVRAAIARRGPRAALAALRPAQWTKNLVLLAPALFALRLTDAASAGRALLAVAIFCLLASASYLANDVVDRERDRHHPVKRLRPVAAGELAPGAALGLAGALAAAGLGAATLLPTGFLAGAAAYVVLQAAYSRALKRVPVVDVFAIAAGFVLRVLAGAEAIPVPVSNWLYLCTLLLSLFLALAKRRAELTLLAGGAHEHRAALTEYSLPLLDQLLTIASACTVLAYALYTLAPDTVEKFHGDRLKYTIPFVIYGLFRYLFLVHRREAGGQPELTLLRDRSMQVNLVAWVATVVWAIYARP